MGDEEENWGVQHHGQAVGRYCVQWTRFESQLSHLFISCRLLGQLLNLSEPEFLHLYN